MLFSPLNNLKYRFIPNRDFGRDVSITSMTIYLFHRDGNIVYTYVTTKN